MATYEATRYTGIVDAGLIVGTSTYVNSSNLPTSNVEVGAMAYVSGTNKLYMWNGTAWFNIAIVNQAPTAITGNQATYDLATDGTPTLVTLVSTDPEGLPLTWSSSTSGDTQVGTVSLTDNVFTITPTTNEANIGTLSVTFSVTDGNNTETSVSSFTLEFQSPYWDETVLSIGTSSTNGLANNTFIDRSTNAHTVTPAGTPVQTAFHPYLENWSLYNSDNNNGFYKDFGAKPAPLAFVTDTTSDGTIEAWIHLDQTPDSGAVAHVGSTIVAIGDTYFAFLVTSTLKLRFYWYPGSPNVIDSTGSVSLHVWHHVAMVKDGDAIAFYIDGVVAGTGTITTTNWASGSNGNYLRIANNLGSNDTAAFKGHLSNLRLTDAIVYSGAFTTPTEKLTAITGTSLLTCQSNRFVDNSSNAHTFTPMGSVKVSAFNPFGQESDYAVGENKGSTYFDGTGDYLTVASDAGFGFGTGDFTIEAWVYWLGENSNAAYGIVSTRSSVASEGLVFYAGVSGFLTYYDGPGNVNYASTQKLPINQWSYVVLTRSNNVWRLFFNGLEIKTHTSSSDLGSSQPVRIGSLVNGDTFAFNGYISNVRIVKGTALYTSNFTPPTAPVGNTNASLYLPMDNAGIFDKTGNNTLTPVGNASTSTTQTKYADTAMYFDGAGDYVSIPNSALSQFGSDNLTWEMWINTTSATQYATIYSLTPSAFSTGMWSLMMNIQSSTSGDVGIFMHEYSSGTPLLQTTSVSIRDGNWHHVAVVRDGSSWVLYVDGISRATQTWSGTIATITSDIYVGADQHYLRYFQGYIENFQILKGVAKYTANFTVPDRTQGRGYQEES